MDCAGSVDESTIHVDPLFCGLDLGDWTLRDDSPCLPEHNDCGVLMGALGTGCTVSPTSTQSWGGIKGIFRSGDR